MANKVYKVDETAVTWNDSTGATTITLNNLAAGAGRQGDQYDLGAGGTARAYRFMWRFRCRFATAPVVNEMVEVYLKTSDGTRIDNDDGTTDAAVSAGDKRKNLQLLGVCVVDEAATGVDMVCQGVVEIFARYIQPVIWNATADNLVATNDLNDFILTPIPDEIQ